MSTDKSQPQDPLEAQVAKLIRETGKRTEPPADRARRIREHAHAHWIATRTPVARTRSSRSLTFAAAAAFVVAAVALTFLLRPTGGAVVAHVVLAEGTPQDGDGRTLAASEPIGAGAAIETGSRARLALRLASGPSLRVDVASALTLHAGGSVELRRGAIYVDTMSARPADVAWARVETPFGTLHDVGTQFEVRLTDASLAVRVREGTVRWTHATLTRDVHAGRELTIGFSHAIREAAIDRHGLAWKWLDSITPALEIDGRSASEFLDWAARERGVRLEYADEALAQTAQSIELSGSIPGMTVDEALATVLPTCRLRHRFAGDRLIVESSDFAPSR